MTVSNIATPVLTSLTAPMAPPPSAAAAAIIHAPDQEVGSTSLPRMQNLGLTNLRQTVMQGLNDQVSSRFPTALNNNDTKDKAAGAALTVGGAMLQGVGKQLARSGGFGAKVAGAVATWMGRGAEEIGKDKYSNAGSSSNGSGGYNAYSPSNWKRSSDQRP